MAEFRLSPAVQADLDGIFDYSLRQWGVDQALRYTQEREDLCTALAQPALTHLACVLEQALHRAHCSIGFDRQHLARPGFRAIAQARQRRWRRTFDRPTLVDTDLAAGVVDQSLVVVAGRCAQRQVGYSHGSC